MNRREFVGLCTGAALTPVLGRALQLAPNTTLMDSKHPMSRMSAKIKLHPFDYSGVRLLDSPLQHQAAATRDFYFQIPDDDILKGFRQKAGLPAPGESMGGWCSDTTAVVFGQWLSGMARLSHATDDTALRDKAAGLMTEWGKTAAKLHYDHYGYEKFSCGLVDMATYANHPDALPLLAQITDWAEINLGRARLPATDADSQGGFFNGQIEWYTLPENLYRAYVLTGDQRYKTFGDVWRYPHYWNMFNGLSHEKPDGFHAYSHVNALSSAAMTYSITGDPQYLKTLVNAYDYFQSTQCYATGGYGPGEKLMPADGSLGNSVVEEPNAKYLSGSQGRSFETPCGTWGVFKLTRYLQQFTGEARYGDWMERVLYNGIGSALPMHGRGETFYYADYRVTGGAKEYYGDHWPCCSGTYLQNIADYHNIVYYHDSAGLYINLYVPSLVTWSYGDQKITVTQRTDYPREETISLMLQMAHPARFPLHFRVPGWAENVTASTNGTKIKTTAKPGTWAVLLRTWNPGDQITIRIPMSQHAVPIDSQHPNQIAYVQGPVVMVRPMDTTAKRELVPFSQMEHHARYQMYVDMTKES